LLGVGHKLMWRPPILGPDDFARLDEH
jgi:hypothetical protein